MPWDWEQRPRDPQRQRGFELVGAMIRRKRMWLGWTQRVLESQSGIDQTVISRLENGRQYGLHWKRFADLVVALDGFDLVTRSARLDLQPPRVPDRIDLGGYDAEDDDDDDVVD
jgi:transcriptional regulator with XRE-family HTH domain